MNRRRAALTTLAGSSVTTLLVGVQALVLIPLYLGTVGPRLYGAWLGSGDVLVWLQAFDLGLPNLITQRVGAAYGRGDSKTANAYFASGMVVMGAVAAIVGFAAVTLSPLVASVFGIAGKDGEVLSQCFALAAVGSAVNLFTNGIVGFSRGIQRTGFLSVVSVVATILGFGVSLALVLGGEGLWAIAFGLAARSAVILGGAAVFVGLVFRGGLIRECRPRWPLLRELATLVPATGLGGAAYTVMAQSESFIAATILRPELAAVLGLTRKLLELGRGVIDTIAFAVYGGFAHLVASGERNRVLKAIAEVSAVRTSLALTAAAAFMAVNGAVVRLWVGADQYGGPFLTALLALQFVVTGSAFFSNYIYRAMGPVMQGSLALAAESALRIPLMVVAAGWLGLPGIPLTGIVTASVFLALAHRWTVSEVSSFAAPPPPSPPRVLLARIAVFGTGAALSVVAWRSWAEVAAASALVSMAGGMLLLALDPRLQAARAALVSTARNLAATFTR